LHAPVKLAVFVDHSPLFAIDRYRDLGGFSLGGELLWGAAAAGFRRLGDGLAGSGGGAFHGSELMKYSDIAR
jgi:hypothetical protein